MNELQNLERVQYITRNFSALQGLKMLPFGLFMLALAARDFGWGFLGQEGDCTYTLPLFFVVLALVYLTSRYYDQAFGSVKEIDHSTSAFISAAYLFVLLLVIVVEVQLNPPVSLVALLLASTLLFVGIKKQRPYYTFFALVMVGISFLPLIQNTSLENPYYGSLGGFAKLAIGMIWIAAGLIDHVKLVRIIKQVSGGVND